MLLSTFHSKSPGRRLGITVTEALIAAFLLSLVFGIAWKLFSTGARSAELAAWHTVSQQQLRNALKGVRDDLARASYPSVVGPTSVTLTKAGRGFQYRKGKLQLDEASGETQLMSFYICRPRREGFGGSDDDSGETIHATLSAKGNTLVYKKTGASDPVRNCDKVLVREVDYVNLDGPDTAPAEKSTTVLLEVKTVHKIWKQTGVLEQTNPKVEVEVKSGL